MSYSIWMFLVCVIKTFTTLIRSLYKVSKLLALVRSIQTRNIFATEFFSEIVDDAGAKNVVSVCRECNVKQLIYNSSADVVLDGSRDIIRSDESIPYPCKVRVVLDHPVEQI